jgi:hypothetical protein
MDGSARSRAAPLSYFHVIFTLPWAIGDIAYHNKAVIYGLLFSASVERMLTIAPMGQPRGRASRRSSILSRAGYVSDISDWLAIEGSRHRGRDHAPVQTSTSLAPVDQVRLLLGCGVPRPSLTATMFATTTSAPITCRYRSRGRQPEASGKSFCRVGWPDLHNLWRAKRRGDQGYLAGGTSRRRPAKTRGLRNRADDPEIPHDRSCKRS